jgi:hypothetical protein
VTKQEKINFIRHIGEQKLKIAKMQAELSDECRALANQMQMPFVNVSDFRENLEQQLLEEIINDGQEL